MRTSSSLRWDSPPLRRSERPGIVSVVVVFVGMLTTNAEVAGEGGLARTITVTDTPAEDPGSEKRMGSSA